MNGLLLAHSIFHVHPDPQRAADGAERRDGDVYRVAVYRGAHRARDVWRCAVVYGRNRNGLIACIGFRRRGGRSLLTGGLHMDGFADMGDAFFSYRDKEKRLEILDDPRIGAFGAMALILLIVVKIALLEELIHRNIELLPFFIAVPFLARAGMNVYFSSTRLAKEKGIAHFFKGKLGAGKLMAWSIIMGLAVVVALGLVLHSIIVASRAILVVATGQYFFSEAGR